MSVILSSFGVDNGFSPIRRQAIIYTNTDQLDPLQQTSVKCESKY